MDNDISDMMKKFSDMMANSSSSSTSNSDNSQKENSSFDFSKISPEMLGQFASMFQNNSTGNSTDKPNFDMATLLKMKSAMEKINQKDDPRSNLLRSLKPYLKESRKEKVDQYISLFNMGKVIEVFKETGGGKK